MANNNNNFGASFNLDVTKLKSGLATANKMIRESESNFKAAAAGMGDWTQSQEGLEKRIGFLNAKIDQQKKVIEETTKEKERIVQAMKAEGKSQEEIAAATDEANKILNKQYTELAKSQKELKQQQAALANLANENIQAASAFDKLTNEIDDQESELTKLKKEYASVVLEQGKNSRAAKDLANNIEELSKGLKDNKTKLSDVTKESDDLDKSLDDAGDAAESSASGGFTVLKGTLANLASDGIQAVLGGISDLVGGMKELAGDSITANSQFAASTGSSKKELDEFNDSMQNLYKGNYGESMNDLADKMGKVKQANKDLNAGEIEKVTKNLIVLEDVFDMDFNETMRGVDNLMTHFGLSSDEAFDLIAKGAQNGLNYTDELGDNISEYGGNFKQAGYSADEYFQLLENGTQGGAYNLDKVNDSINEVKNRLGDGTIAKNIGMFSKGTQEAFKNWQNGKGTMKNVIDSIVGDISRSKSEQDKLTMAQTAFGTMGEDANLKVVESLTTVGNSYTDVKGKMDEIDQVKYDNPIAQLEAIGRTIKTEVIEPVLDKVVPKVSEFLDGIDLDKLGNDIGTNIGGFVDEMLPKIDDFLENFDISSAVDSLDNLATNILPAITDAIKWIFDNKEFILGLAGVLTGIAAAIGVINAVMTISNAIMMLSPTTWIVMGIVAAVAALIAIVVVCIKHWDQIREAGEKAVEGIKKVWSDIGKWFGERVDDIKKAFSDIGTWFKTKFKEASDGIRNVFSSIGSFFGNIVTKIKTTFGNIGSWFKGKFQEAVNGIKNVFSGIGKFFGGIWDTIKSKFTSIGTKIGDAIGGAFKSAINAVLRTVEKGINFVPKSINKALDKINKLPGVSIGKMSEISLPRLAKGGVVRGATNAIIGEDGAEAVVPLERNRQWIRAVAEEMKMQQQDNKQIVVNQTNNFDQSHSRYEMYQTKRQTAAAVRLAVGGAH